MRDGRPLRYPRNPLDIVAQQIVAMTAMDDWAVDDLERVIHQAAPFAELPRSAFEGVLDMLSGRYPSDEFAELRPRIVWDRTAGVLRSPASVRIVRIAERMTGSSSTTRIVPPSDGPPHAQRGKP